MVGMDAPVNLEKPKERDCVCADLLISNGEATFQSQSHDSKLPEALVDDAKFNGKLAILCPITPSPCRENGESIHLPNSPLSSESPKSPDVESFNSTESDGGVGSGHDNSPRTPDEGVFDPFAPGPEELLRAPICKKVIKKSWKIVARRLHFDDEDDKDVDVDDSPKSGDDSSNEVDTFCEKTVMDAVYGTVLETIILKQVEEENHSSESETLPDTATSPPPSLTGIAETCPEAPLKAIAGKSRNIDPGLCRKLEF